jgi:acetyl-CoA carboxylase biotin carboxyl carrier protein
LVELTNEDVADILALLDSLPYDELDLQTSKFRLTLRRGAHGSWTREDHATADPAITDAGDDGDSHAEQAEVPGGAASEASGNSIPITTPLPGTFYRAPRPGAAPFTEVGAQVSEDTVVAIVETMKLMNPVHAGARGRVAAILIGNAEAVTQGTVLMRIDPGDEREVS